MSAPAESSSNAPNPLMEIVQPFVDVVKAPRALWGINLAYVLEGFVYFGMLGYLAMHFTDNVFPGIPHVDEWSHSMVMILTAGITLSMVVFGGVCDKWGVRKALLLAFALLLGGRSIIAAAPFLGLEPGLGGSLHIATVAGILFVVAGYGLYQPSAYAAVRQFTTPKTAAMGFAMLYALMNLGGWLPTFAFVLRDEKWLGFGIPGTYVFYTGVTVVALAVTMLLLTRKTVENAIATAKAESAAIQAEVQAGKSDEQKEKERIDAEKAAADLAARPIRVPVHIWLLLVACVGVAYWRVPLPYAHAVAGALVAIPVVIAVLPAATRKRAVTWIAHHPLADARFFAFIFALIPVQTLFTYNWLVLPQYISRSFTGFIGEYFEVASNLNPILIFIAVPVIAALTRKANVYGMMIIGTAVMAAPAFLLVIGPYWWTLLLYILIMTVGEAMWQPRFLQYAAEIAPEGRTGQYMGVAQLPWFLTKMLSPLLLTGWMMDRYCPAEGPADTRTMWLIYATIAMSSTVILVLARGWISKGMKTQSA